MVSWNNPHTIPSALPASVKAEIAKSMSASRQRRRHLRADARLALRHDGKEEAGDEDAALVQRLRQLLRELRIAQHDRNDRRLALEDREARLLDAFAEPLRMRLQQRAPVIGFDRDLERLEGPGGDRGGERVGEQIGPRPLAQKIDDRLRGGDEAAHAAAERLAERPGHDVDAVARAGQRRRSAPLLAEMPGRMAVVDQHQRAIAVGERADLLELRDIAVHREHAVGGDELEPRARRVRLLEPVFELVHVGIGEAVALGLARAARRR